jgi:hypothetical protein
VAGTAKQFDVRPFEGVAAILQLVNVIAEYPAA